MKLILPNVLVLGAPKSGTTWLYDNLQGHPQIATPRKEIHYFSNKKDKGLEWYVQHFADVYHDQPIVLEVAVNYLYHYDYRGLLYPYNPQVAEDIKHTLDTPRFIVLLRDPVDRAFSDYIHFMQAVLKYGHVYRGKARPPQKDEAKRLAIHHPAKRDNPDMQLQLHSFYASNDVVDTLLSYPFLIERGRYDIYIKHYLQLFDRDQFLFLDFNEIRQTPQKLMESICDFLEIERWYDQNTLMQRSNQAEKRSLPRSWYWQAYFAKQMRKGRSPRMMKQLMRLNERLGAKPRISDDLATILARWYEPHNRELAMLTGLDLKHWRKP